MALERNYYKLRLSYTPIGGGERKQKERVILASSSRMALFIFGIRTTLQDGNAFTDNPDRVIHPGADIEIELLSRKLTSAQIFEERFKGTPFSEDIIC